MQQTPNLDLELYEPTDNANLEDGYNRSMRKLDQRDGEVSTLIAALNTTVQGYDTRIATAETNAATAATAASEAATAAATADSKATAAGTTAATAAGNAAQALTQLGGVHFEHIHNDDRGTKWQVGAWASNTCVFNAMIIYDETEGHGLLIGEFWAASNNSTGTTAWEAHNVVQLRDWGRDTSEGHEDYGYVRVVNNDWANAATVSRLDANGNLYWTVFTGASSSLPAQEGVTGIVISPVFRRN